MHTLRLESCATSLALRPTRGSLEVMTLLISSRLQISLVPIPTPKGNEVLVRLSAAALNHRDVFLRQLLYPGAHADITMGSDGAGTVVGVGPLADSNRWLNRLVVLNPGTGWNGDPCAPETGGGGYRAMGGSTKNIKGTMCEYLTIAESELELAPTHLSMDELAALPVTGLTAWRAVVTKSGNWERGRNVLVTGIGGGVALMALEFLRAKGCNVFVTSSSDEKLRRAIDELGALGGVNYRTKGWEGRLIEQLPDERKELDAIIDGAGGDVVEKGMRILKNGGVIASYGMTVGPTMPFPMRAVLQQIEVRCSTMGSRKEFADMMEFVRTTRLRPVVSRVIHGLQNLDVIESLFEEMRQGKQFGKLVVRIWDDRGKGKL